MSSGIRPTIHVRPIAWSAGSDDLRYVSDGLGEDVAVELSRFRGLFDVVRVEDRWAAARRAPGDYALGGTVRRTGDRLRVTVVLTGDDDVELWAERYDRTGPDLLAAQDELASAIAATTAGRIVDLGVARARGRPADTLGPFDALVLGLDLLNRYAADANRLARTLFGQVLTRDPGSARAAAGLASSWLYEWMIRPAPETLERAYEGARAALALDGADAWCHMIVGRVHLTARRFDLAEHFYDRAARLNPSDTDILASYGIALAYLGRPEDGIAMLARARRLNPYPPGWHDENLGFALFVAGRYDEAIATFDRMEDAPSWVHCARAAAYHHLGNGAAARAAIDQALAADPSERVSVFAASEPFRRAADLERFLAGLRGAGLPE